MVRKYLVTEDEFLSATVNGAGELVWTRDNGEQVVAGAVVGPAVTDAQITDIATDPETSFGSTLSSTYARGISVASKGAVGDGVTDDSAAIRAAITSAAAFGAQVWLPRSTYVVSRVNSGTAYALAVPAGVSLRSDGATLKLADGQLDYTSVIRPQGSGALIQGLTIDGNRANQSVETQKQRHGVYIDDVTDVSVVDCRIIDCAGDGILVHDGAERTTVRGNTISGCARSGVAVTGAAHETAIDDNRIFGNDATPIDGEVEGTFARDVHIRGNFLEAVAGEYALTNSTAVSSQRNLRWIIEGNTIIGGVYLVRSIGTRLAGNSIRTTSGTIPAVTASITERTSIEGNVIDAFAKGIVAVFTLSVAPTNISVVNNDIVSGNSAIELAGVLDAVVHLNRCVGNAVGQGIIITSTGGNVTDVEVTDNHVRNFATAGVYVATVGAATINGLTISGNKFRGALSYGIQLAGPASGYSSVQVEGNMSNTGVTFAFSDGTTAGPVPVSWVSGRMRETQGAAAPTTGTWAIGDRCWNTAPAASGTMGWVCVTAGTPGTWKTFASVAA